jgi:inosine/xanthosine triphosphate pyrophosphatase family protein
VFKANGLKKVSEITSGTGALEAFDDKSDIQVQAEGTTPGLFGKDWFVAVYVDDTGNARHVEAISHDGFNILAKAVVGVLSMPDGGDPEMKISGKVSAQIAQAIISAVS